MTFIELKDTISTPFFTTLQVVRLFPHESSDQIKVQLGRFVRRGLLIRLKRGTFLFSQQKIDPFEIAQILHPRSYVSVESALNAYGMIPDIPTQVTSVTPLTTKSFKTSKGVFLFSKINPLLYYGFKIIRAHPNSYMIAEPEKALLDYIYLRKVSDLEESRIDMSMLSISRLHEFSQPFPQWVKKIIAQEKKYE